MINKKKFSKFSMGLIIFALLTIIPMSSFGRKPLWSIDPSQFNYSMSIVGTVYQSDVRITNSISMIAAFVGAECRGVAHSVQQDPHGYHMYHLTVWGKTDGEKIKFVYYNAMNDTTEAFEQSELFKNDGLIGSNYRPYLWSTNDLVGVDVEEFHIPGSICSEIEEDVINVIVTDKTLFENAKPKFKLSTGAYAEIGANVLLSEKSENDFSNDVLLKITSGNRKITKTYTIKLVDSFMTLVSRVVLTSKEVVGSDGILVAFVDGIERNRSKAILIKDINKYRFNLKVYGKRENQKISFKYYPDEFSSVKILDQKIDFKMSTSYWTHQDPLFLSNNDLEDTEIDGFRVDNQINNTVVKDENTIKIIIPSLLINQPQVTYFNVTENAVVRVNGIIQYSGITKVDYSNGPVTFVVHSSNRTQIAYKIVEPVTEFMDINSRVIIDQKEINNDVDTLYAIIDGVVRASATAKFHEAIGKFRFKLRLYNNDTTEQVTFRYRNKILGKASDLVQKIIYKSGKVEGSIVDPLFLSDRRLSSVDLTDYSINSQIRPTIQKNDSLFKVVVTKPRIGTPMIANFKVPDGATVRVNGVIQYSGITTNDFSRGSITYMIYSGNGDLLKEVVVHVFPTYMSLTSRIVINQQEVANLGDTLYAYIDGVLREKTVPVFDDNIQKYRFRMRIYHNVFEELVSFVYYDSKLNKKTQLIQNVQFDVDKIEGSINDPFTLSDSELITYKLNSFSIDGQSNVYFKNDTIIKVLVPSGFDIYDATAIFNVDNAAVVKIGNTVQYSGITKNDFSEPVRYDVYSGNGLTKSTYRVELFSSSMVLTSRVLIDQKEVVEANDTLCAFIDGIVRAKCSPILDEAIQKYRFNMQIFDNLKGQDVNFKLYVAKERKYIDLKQTINFDPSAPIGSSDDPFVFSNSELVESTFLDFKLKDQLSVTIYENDNNMKIILPADADLVNQVALFKVDEGATVRVNGVVQYSGITANDFTEPVVFHVISGDGQTTTTYSVNTLLSQLDDLKENGVVTPDGNGTNDTWVIENHEKFRYSTVFIYNIHGDLVFEMKGYNNSFDGTFRGEELPVSTYYYLIKSPEGELQHKGSITLMR